MSPNLSLTAGLRYDFDIFPSAADVRVIGKLHPTNYGNVFKMTPAGVVTNLFSFAANSNGYSPAGQLVQGDDGNFYGVTKFNDILEGGLNEQFFGTIAVLHIGGVNHDPQHHAERINQDVPLAADDLLAGVIPLRIDRGPPFCAALALWLSLIAAEGLASWHASSRQLT